MWDVKNGTFHSQPAVNFPSTAALTFWLTFAAYHQLMADYPLAVAQHLKASKHGKANTIT